jgi:hypothetical protein
MGTETSCELIRYVDDLDLVVFGALHRVSFGFLSPRAGPASSMMTMVCLLHDFALAKVTSASLAT